MSFGRDHSPSSASLSVWIIISTARYVHLQSVFAVRALILSANFCFCQRALKALSQHQGPG